MFTVYSPFVCLEKTLIVALHKQGLPKRQIAQIIGVDERTVRRDLESESAAFAAEGAAFAAEKDIFDFEKPGNQESP